MQNKYKKINTYLVRTNENVYLRWASDNTLFYAGSFNDAMEDLNPKLFTAVPVCDAPLEIQKEYENLINNLDNSN